MHCAEDNHDKWLALVVNVPDMLHLLATYRVAMRDAYKTIKPQNEFKITNLIKWFSPIVKGCKSRGRHYLALLALAPLRARVCPRAHLRADLDLTVR